MDKLLETILTALNTHIETIVTQKFEQLLEGYNVVAQLDGALAERIKLIAEDVMDSHCVEFDHSDIPSSERLYSVVGDMAHDIAYEVVSNYDHSDALNDIVDEKIDSTLDELLDDKIASVLSDTKFVITGGTITTEV